MTTADAHASQSLSSFSRATHTHTHGSCSQIAKSERGYTVQACIARYIQNTYLVDICAGPTEDIPLLLDKEVEAWLIEQDATVSVHACSHTCIYSTTVGEFASTYGLLYFPLRKAYLSNFRDEGYTNFRFIADMSIQVRRAIVANRL